MMRMKVSQCTMAAITAFIMTAAMAASAAPAFAYEGAEALINSYGNPVAQDIAEYCLDNGMSLEETKELVDGYEERHPVTAARSATVDTTVDGPYHNSDHLSSQQHFVAAIVTNTSRTLDEKFTLTFETNYSTYGDAYSLCGRYTSDSSKLFSVNVPQANKVVTVFYTPNTTASASMDALMRYYVDPVNAANERNLIDHIAFTDNNNRGIIDYDTYALGDVNHDGYVNQNDADCILEYLVEIRSDFAFTYSDQATNPKASYAAITNFLAADMNQDGNVTLIDNTRLNQWISKYGSEE
jgi:hypothetical protein